MMILPRRLLIASLALVCSMVKMNAMEQPQWDVWMPSVKMDKTSLIYLKIGLHGKIRFDLPDGDQIQLRIKKNNPSAVQFMVIGLECKQATSDQVGLIMDYLIKKQEPFFIGSNMLYDPKLQNLEESPVVKYFTDLECAHQKPYFIGGKWWVFYNNQEKSLRLATDEEIKAIRYLMRIYTGMAACCIENDESDQEQQFGLNALLLDSKIKALIMQAEMMKADTKFFPNSFDDEDLNDALVYLALLIEKGIIGKDKPYFGGIIRFAVVATEIAPTYENLKSHALHLLQLIEKELIGCNDKCAVATDEYLNKLDRKLLKLLK